MARQDQNQVVYVDGDVPQLPLQLGQLLVDSSSVSPGNTNLQQCTSQDPLEYEPVQGGYPITPQEEAAGVTVVNTNYPEGHVFRYGATGDGVTDDGPAFNQMSLVVGEGVNGYVPGGYTYMLATQWAVEFPARDNIIYGYGAVLKTTGAITACNVTGSRGTIAGFSVDHNGNALALGAFKNTFSSYNNYRDLKVNASGVGATYYAIRLENGDTSDPDTGSFWTTVDNLECRSGDSTLAMGVQLVGAANATNIVDCKFAGVPRPVAIEGLSSPDYTANACNIGPGNAFEGFTTGIDVVSAATDPCSGLKVFCNRFEAGTEVMKLTGSTVDAAAPPRLWGNFTSGTGYITNASNVAVNSFDAQITPAINPDLISASAQYRVTSGNWKLRAATDQGYELTDGAGTTTNATLVNRSGGGAKLNVTNGLVINGNIGFNNSAFIAKPTITGSKGGNAALTSLLTALANYGLITDSTT